MLTNDEARQRYEVCQERGHTGSGTTLTSNPPWSVCSYCGTAYRFEQKLIEMDVPDAAH